MQISRKAQKAKQFEITPELQLKIRSYTNSTLLHKQMSDNWLVTLSVPYWKKLCSLACDEKRFKYAIECLKNGYIQTYRYNNLEYIQAMQSVIFKMKRHLVKLVQKTWMFKYVQGVAEFSWPTNKIKEDNFFQCVDLLNELFKAYRDCQYYVEFEEDTEKEIDLRKAFYYREASDVEEVEELDEEEKKLEEERKKEERRKGQTKRVSGMGMGMGMGMRRVGNQERTTRVVETTVAEGETKEGEFGLETPTSLTEVQEVQEQVVPTAATRERLGSYYRDRESRQQPPAPPDNDNQ